MRGRPLTPTERQQRSAQMKAAWAEGRFANRRPRRKIRNHWTPEQNRALTELAGTRPVPEIIAEMERRFYIRRTEPSVRIQAKRLGISLWQGGYSLRELERIFGTAHHTITPKWIEAGHISGYRWAARGPNPGWWFEATEVERFVRECGWLYHLDKMQPGHRLTRLAQISQKADPWIVGTDAVAGVLGLATVQVHKWLRRGLIPHKRRPWGGGSSLLVVRGRDVPAIREAIRAAQQAARREQYDRFTRVAQARAAQARAFTLEHADQLVGACRRGHPRNVETTLLNRRGKLTCLECRRERQALGRAG